MTLDERLAVAREAHRQVWTKEPITRCAVVESVAREGAAKAAYNDSKQALSTVIT